MNARATPCEPRAYEPWAMDALAILARRHAPAPGAPEHTAHPGALAHNIETLIHERMTAP
jgi:hypothetical protein